MSRYVNIDQIIADIYEKWGCDPAYYVGVSGADAHEAKLDADLIEFLRSKPHIDIVRCEKCQFFKSIKMSGGYLSFCRKHRLIDELSQDDFCSCGERRKPNE